MPGKPGARADLRAEVPVLLLHGTADPVVPVSFTEQFAAALDGGGHELTTQYLEGVDHDTVCSAEVVAPIIAEWFGLDGVRGRVISTRTHPGVGHMRVAAGVTV
jgi:predicted esterase